MQITLLSYRGHIRNWKALGSALKVDETLTREDREREILIKGYQKWGLDLPHHLYGMFAFALKEDERIVAFRDQFGTKPFYYYVTDDGKLLFGTYIKDILTQPGFCKVLNEEALQHYLTLTYVGGEDTFFKGIKKLMPGHCLTFAGGHLSVQQYWMPEFTPDITKTPEEYADEIHHTLAKIMEEMDEEETDAFLSSGVDSSYILAMSKAARADTCGYADKKFDESALAEQTSHMLGRPINRYLITPESYFSEVPTFCKNAELPLGDASAVVYSIACRQVARHAKVCYSGEGSDEFFGGYRMYQNAQRYKDHLHEFYAGNTMIMNEEEKKELLLRYEDGQRPVDLVRNTYKTMGDLDPLAKMMRIDMELWLEGDIYLNVDKMSAACGLEVRMPLTDMRMFRLASRIPSEYKVTADENKLVFRMAAGKVLPEEVAFRKKLGFIVPIRYWLADPQYNGGVKEKLFGKSAEKFFRMDKLRSLFDAYLAGNSDLWRKIWTIYIFLEWYDIYFGEECAKEAV